MVNTINYDRAIFISIEIHLKNYKKLRCYSFKSKNKTWEEYDLKKSLTIICNHVYFWYYTFGQDPAPLSINVEALLIPYLC